MDLDLRKLRYFRAVVEHGGFGRAARELHIAQPVLSRQIRALEQELGQRLFDRTTRSVEPTAAGRQLYEEARRIGATVELALRRVAEAARGEHRLVVAFSAGLRVSEAIREFTARHPEVKVDVLPLPWTERDAPLRDGRAQVALLRRPFDDTGLRTVPIGEEGKVACLPAAHRLAGRASLTTADLAGEPVLAVNPRRAPSLEEKFERIASGQGVTLVPVSVAASYLRPDLVFLPVTDHPPVGTCLAVPDGEPSEAVAGFLEIATAVLLGQA